MPPQAPSPFAWPILLGASSLAFPALAALYARRPLRRDPAAQLAAALLVVGGVNVLSLGQVLGLVPRAVPLSAISNGLSFTLVIGPVLAWLGARPRDRVAAQAAVATAWVAGLLLLGTGREFGLVAVPVKGIVMTAVSAAALARCVRHSAATGSHDSRLTILGGLVTYYLVNTITRPLVETLFASNYQATVDAHMGAQLVYAGCMTAIAVGVARYPSPHAQPAAAAPAAASTLAPNEPVAPPADAYPAPPRAARRAV